MKFTLKATDLFYEQLNTLDQKTKLVVKQKIQLIETNPYRFKKLNWKKFKLFRVRINVSGKASRLVYCVIEPEIILICFIERKRRYKDLRRYMKNFLKK
ncbi:hypothetical protein CL622_00160 [archaeon]|nr:hypothetical protein [archaeon]|tara:strand:- start:155 stop:451 length:297 start_codon:yes stop_codon:yes gene_type:complete